MRLKLGTVRSIILIWPLEFAKIHRNSMVGMASVF